MSQMAETTKDEMSLTTRTTKEGIRDNVGRQFLHRESKDQADNYLGEKPEVISRRKAKKSNCTYGT